MKIPDLIKEQLIQNNLDAIMTTNANCEIEYANRSAYELYGYSEKEFKDKHISIFDVLGQEIPVSAWKKLGETGKWEGEALRKRKDGSVFPASISIFAIYDSDKKIIGYAGNTRDLSKSHLANEALREKQNQLSSVIDNTVDIIVSIDKDLKLVEFNRVMAGFAFQGFKHELKRGDNLLDYIDPKKHDHLKSIYQRVFKGERVFDIEVFDSITQTSIYFESSYNPIFNSQNEVIGISIFSKNITDRVINEQKLKKALTEKDILLSEIHHRLKNNLAIISSILHLQELNITNKEAIRALNESRMRIKSTALLHEMLYQSDSLDKICVKKYLQELFKDINTSMGGSRFSLEVNGDEPSLLFQNAVPTGLLFNELFTNAIKHGFSGKGNGKINIDINTIEDKTKFTFTENGNVFPEQIDLQNSNSTGLTLIKTFTEQLNGEIKLKKKPNTQYEFTLQL